MSSLQLFEMYLGLLWHLLWHCVGHRITLVLHRIAEKWPSVSNIF